MKNLDFAFQKKRWNVVIYLCVFYIIEWTPDLDDTS